MANTSGLSALAQKIADAIAERNKRKYEDVEFEALGGETLKVHSLTDIEYMDINAKSAMDKMLLQRLIYEACDDLRERSKELVKAGIIHDGYEVTGFLSPGDIAKISTVVNRLSGRGAESKIKIGEEIEAIKNS